LLRVVNESDFPIQGMRFVVGDRLVARSFLCFVQQSILKKQSKLNGLTAGSLGTSSAANNVNPQTTQLHHVGTLVAFLLL